MTSIVDALYELKYNPFEYGECLASFYTTLEGLENNILLAPLVIPLCSHPTFGTKLSNSISTSTIWSVFGDRTKLYDLQERIDGFLELTEECIQFCLANDWLSVSLQNLSFSASEKPGPAFANSKGAQKLGRLLSGYSVIEIYSFFGVKPR